MFTKSFELQNIISTSILEMRKLQNREVKELFPIYAFQITHMQAAQLLNAGSSTLLSMARKSAVSRISFIVYEIYGHFDSKASTLQLLGV